MYSLYGIVDEEKSNGATLIGKLYTDTYNNCYEKLNIDKIKSKLYNITSGTEHQNNISHTCHAHNNLVHRKIESCAPAKCWKRRR